MDGMNLGITGGARSGMVVGVSSFFWFLTRR
jgi:hypothetical protein